MATCCRTRMASRIARWRAHSRIVGERWTLLVLRDAFYEIARRFNDFLAHLDMPRAVLSNRLRSLIERGLLVKVPDAGHSGRWLYELTDEGMALWPALYALRSWGERQSGRQPRMFTHDACDTPLDATGRCETCGVLPAPNQIFVSPLGEPRAGRADRSCGPCTAAQAPAA